MGAVVVFQGRIISIEVRGTCHGTREVVVHPGAVAVLAYDREGRILLVRQHREGVGGPLWEIPAGVLEQGEKPLAAAKRELNEETGLIGRRWQYLGTIYPTPGYSTERTYLFLASELCGTPVARSEVDEVRSFTVEELRRLVRSGHGDAKTLAALTLAGTTSPPNPPT